MNLKENLLDIMTDIEICVRFTWETFLGPMPLSFHSSEKSDYNATKHNLNGSQGNEPDM